MFPWNSAYYRRLFLRDKTVVQTNNRKHGKNIVTGKKCNFESAPKNRNRQRYREYLHGERYLAYYWRTF